MENPSWREQLDEADYRRQRRAMLDEPFVDESEDEPEPQCECVLIDPDRADASACRLHNREVRYAA